MIPILLGLLAGGATLLGMWIVLAREQWARRHAVYLVAFAAGVLIATSFTDIIPEAMELSPHALLVVLGTFFAFYVLEHSVIAHHHHLHEATNDHDAPIEKMAFMGLLVHSLVDGLAIGAGFGVSPALGAVATLAVILHEVPEGITTLSLFLHAAYPRRRAVAWTAAVALATPLGAIATVFIPALAQRTVLGILLGIAGGSFLYVAAADLIPETHRAKHMPAILLMAIGIAVPLIAGRLLGE